MADNTQRLSTGEVKYYLELLLSKCRRRDVWVKVYLTLFKNLPNLTKLDMAHMFAQTNFESNNHNDQEEDLYYTTVDRLKKVFPSLFVPEYYPDKYPKKYDPKEYIKNRDGLAKLRYGHIYYGRGPLMLSLPDNYRNFSTAWYRNLLLYEHPDIVSSNPVVGCQSVIWYWETRKLFLGSDQTLKVNEQKENCKHITSTINPALKGFDGRYNLYKEYEHILFGTKQTEINIPIIANENVKDNISKENKKQQNFLDRLKNSIAS